jgi:hypothetical protein
MRWLWIFATAALTAASSLAEKPLNKSADPAPQEILQWLQTIKLPSMRDCPYIKITITEKNPEQGQPPQVVKLDGILLNETKDDLNVFLIELQEKLDQYYPMMDPPFWPVTVATIHKELPSERAEYTQIPYAEAAGEISKELHLPDEENINQKLWEEATFRHLSKPAAIALFASSCQQNGQEKIGAELIDGIARTYQRYLSEGEKEKPFKKFLEDALSETLVWDATLKFEDVNIPRFQILATFRDLQERFPHSRHQQYLQKTIGILDGMVREDATHHIIDLSHLITEQKISELIFRLRDQHGAQTMQPGICDIFFYDKPNNASAAGQLVNLGYAAVPQLISALDDRRFSRSIHFWRGYVFSHYVLRTGDCAEAVLEKIANRKFYEPKTTSSDMTSDDAVASTKRAVQKWWSEVQSKHDKRSQPKPRQGGRGSGS